MRHELIAWAFLLGLGGCAQHTLIVRGDVPGTAWVAEKAVGVSSKVCESAPAKEVRSAQATRRGERVYIEVQHTCAH